MITVRFAPSPTGSLHIGGARTALFNYLFAKKNNGKFILRIDDTDTSRNSQDSLDSLISDLQWIGIDWDIGPNKSNPIDYQSSHRNHIYLGYANQLVTQNKAIKNDDGSISIKLDKSKDIILDDLIKGKVIFPKDSIPDNLVIIRTNQIATYNFATVIDDHLMNISHIFRADEHLQNTPKQILIYNLFNWDIPKFGHMGLICDMNGKKLSKRDKDVSSISDFKNLGILSDVLTHYLSFLGWGGIQLDNKIILMADLIQQFDLNNVKKGSSKFDIKKLLNLNHLYLRNKPNIFFKQLLDIQDDSYLSLFLSVFLPRSKTIKDLQTNLNSLKNPHFNFDLIQDKLKNYDVLSVLNGFKNKKDLILHHSLIRFSLIGKADGVDLNSLLKLIPLSVAKKRIYFMKKSIIYNIDNKNDL